MESLHSGWLYKSPPEKNSQGPWKWFTSKWRRRYFVLYGIRSNALTLLDSSSDAASMLCYYSDEQRTRELGRIDLKQCQEVHSHLKSDAYPHILAVKTQDEGNERTYCLAAETENEMIEWEKQLNSVLCLYDSGFDQLSNFNTNELEGDNKYPTLPKGISTTRRTSLQVRAFSSTSPAKLARSVTDINLASKKRTPKQTKEMDNDSPSKVYSASKSKLRTSFLSIIHNVGSPSGRRPSCPMISIPNPSLSSLEMLGENAPGCGTPVVPSSARPGKTVNLSSKSKSGQYKSTPQLLDINLAKSDCSSLSDDDKLNSSPKSTEWNSDDSLLKADRGATLKPSDVCNMLSTSARSRSPLPPVPPRVARSASVEESTGASGMKKYLKRRAGSSAVASGVARSVKKGMDAAVAPQRAVSLRSEDLDVSEMGESSENESDDSDYNHPDDWDTTSSKSGAMRKPRRGSESGSSARFSAGDNLSDRLSLNDTLNENDELEDDDDGHYDTLPSMDHEFSGSDVKVKTQLSIVLESSSENYDVLPGDYRRKFSAPSAVISACGSASWADKERKFSYSENDTLKSRKINKRYSKSEDDLSSDRQSAKLSAYTFNDDDDDIYDVPKFLNEMLDDECQPNDPADQFNNSSEFCDYDTLTKTNQSSRSADDLYDYIPSRDDQNDLQNDSADPSESRFSRQDSDLYDTLPRTSADRRSRDIRHHVTSGIAQSDESFVRTSARASQLQDDDHYDVLPASSAGSLAKKKSVDDKDLYDTLPATNTISASVKNNSNENLVKDSAENLSKRNVDEKDLYDTLPSNLSASTSVKNISNKNLATPVTKPAGSLTKQKVDEKDLYDTLPSNLAVSTFAKDSSVESLSTGGVSGNLPKRNIDDKDLYDTLPSTNKTSSDITKDNSEKGLAAGDEKPAPSVLNPSAAIPLIKGRAWSESDDASSIDDQLSDSKNSKQEENSADVVSIKFTRNTRSFKRRDNGARKQIGPASTENSSISSNEKTEPSNKNSSTTNQQNQKLDSNSSTFSNTGSSTGNSKPAGHAPPNDVTADKKLTNLQLIEAENLHKSNKTTTLDRYKRDEPITSNAERKVKAVTLEFERRFSQFKIENSAGITRAISQRPTTKPKPKIQKIYSAEAPASISLPSDDDMNV